MPRGVYDRKAAKVKKLGVQVKPETPAVTPSKDWYKPLSLPTYLTYVEAKAIPKEKRFSCSMFEWNNAVLFMSKLNSKYGIIKFTKPEKINSKWIFYYEM